MPFARFSTFCMLSQLGQWRYFACLVYRRITKRRVCEQGSPSSVAHSARCEIRGIRLSLCHIKKLPKNLWLCLFCRLCWRPGRKPSRNPRLPHSTVASHPPLNLSHNHIRWQEHKAVRVSPTTLRYYVTADSWAFKGWANPPPNPCGSTLCQPDVTVKKRARVEKGYYQTRRRRTALPLATPPPPTTNALSDGVQIKTAGWPAIQTFPPNLSSDVKLHLCYKCPMWSTEPI